MAKTTPWLEIKALYLKGVAPRELAKKYNLTAKQISDRANEERWIEEKTAISEKVRNNVEKRIDRIINLALNRLENVLNDKKTKTNDLVAAIGKAIDISGLKMSKKEITGKDGVPFTVQKEYILPREVEEFKEHYRQATER